MPIEMPRGLPFAVDTWTPASRRKRHRFLTHAHRDHSSGICNHSPYPIYATRVTRIVTLLYYPQLDESLFVDIEVGQTVVIDDNDASFTVTAFDANHCLGAVMFLFEGSFGNILHTGDCRLTPECLQSLPDKYLTKKSEEPKCRLDYVFLDCTFGSASLKMPSKHSAIRQVINCIWKHPDAPIVYLTCDNLGQEEILVNISQAFGSKIYVDKESNPECFQLLKLIAPEILSEEPSSRFHVLDGFPRLSERADQMLAEARSELRAEPLIIRPSAQWYVFEEVTSENEKRRKERFNEAVRDHSGVWHVCYSMHSSREELEWALQLLRPRWVASTTPTCRAMELTYFKRHCFYSHLTSDDPLWKLLDISGDDSIVYNVPAEIPRTYTESSLLQIVESETQKQVLRSSPLRGEPPVTLFGRARLGLNDNILHVAKNTSPIRYKIPDESIEQDVSFQTEDVLEVQCQKTIENNKGDVFEVEYDISSEIKKTTGKRVVSSPTGSSKSYSESLRKLYRTTNVPVPQPLPSLVELMNQRKFKRRFMF